ncbi:hypothetical protein [Lentibacillus saliphilus]|uniref:hypothetical protein n=1 Tax=Lentibacillus saliphilus TaxID=2737028 RepID=UPI001C30801C|nr:hypothetical protein [Lentibacillus saliphilus]
MLALAACQQNELFQDETITSITIEKWDSAEVIHTISDETFIDDLISQLETTDTASTADIDIPHPDYRLVFFDDDRVVKELGYYIEEKNYKGVTGRYIDMKAGNHLGVTTELPINE